MPHVNGGTTSPSKEFGNCFCSCPVFCCMDHHGVATCRSADCRSVLQFSQAAVASRWRRRRVEDNIQRRADRAEALVHMGELSSVRHALEGAALLSGTKDTLRALSNPLKRPPEPREPLPDELLKRRGPIFQLDPDIFAKNLRVARRGAAGGLSGMISEHLRPFLDNEQDTLRFWRFAQDFARAAVLENHC